MIIDNIYEYITSNNLSVSEFQRETGISNGYLANTKKTKGHVGEGIIEKIISTYPEISIEWLITGNGKMYKSNNSSIINEENSLIIENSSLPVNVNNKFQEPAAIYLTNKTNIPVYNLERCIGYLEDHINRKSIVKTLRDNHFENKVDFSVIISSDEMTNEASKFNLPFGTEVGLLTLGRFDDLKIGEPILCAIRNGTPFIKILTKVDEQEKVLEFKGINENNNEVHKIEFWQRPTFYKIVGFRLPAASWSS